jgi:drug/metabolite transporter (DMT)-like permease
MNTNRRHAVAALIAAGLLWGTTVPLTKVALEWLPPGWLTVVRFGLAAAVLLAALLITGQRTALRRAFTPAVLAAGALGYGGSVMVQNAGITRTSVTHAALLIGAVPVLVAIIAAVWHRTVARPVAWFGFAVSLGGVGLVTAGGGGGGATLAGDGLVLASLLLSATVTVAQARLLTGRDPVAVTAMQFLGATLGSLPVAAASEGAPATPTGFGAPLAVVALALAGTLLPFTLFAFGQTRVSAEVAGAFLNLEPLVGAIAGAVAFGDPVGLAQVFGGMAILAGIALSSLPLLAGRRMARRAALVAGAGAAGARAAGAGAAGAGAAGAGAAGAGAAGAGAAAAAAVVTGAGAEAGARTGPAGAGVGTGRLGAEVPRATKPPSPEPALVKVGVNECDSVLDLSVREPHSSDSSERRSGRNGAFVVIRAGKFGAGPPGVGQPVVGQPGVRRPGAGRPGAGRPPVRGRSSGRRPGEPGRRPRRRGLPRLRA